MATQVKILRSSTAAHAPSSLADGELAINQHDGIIFWADDTAAIKSTPLLTNVANGLTKLDGSGKVATAQLPASVLGDLQYQGTWNASTNTPSLASGVGTKGWYYKVSVQGTTAIDGINIWGVGDSIIFDGTTWDRLAGGEPGFRVAVADANHTFATNEEIVAYTSLTSQRVVTLPAANSVLPGTRRHVIDEAGVANTTNYVVVGTSGGDTMNASLYVVLNIPHGHLTFESDGVSKWTIIGRPTRFTVKPQGRLTLAAATPVMTSTVTASAFIFYTPYEGNFAPIWDGEGFVQTPIPEMSNTLASAAAGNAGPFVASGNAVYDLFLWNNPASGALALTRGDMWQQTATVTITQATPGVVSHTAHGLLTNAPVRLATTGTLPAGLAIATTYYVTAPTANTYQLAAAPNGAAINTTTAGSGVHTAIEGIGQQPVTTQTPARGTGNDITTVNGIKVNASAIPNGPAAGAGTFLGSFSTDATATPTCTWSLGGTGAGGVVGNMNLSNAYNRVKFMPFSVDSSGNHTYTTASFRSMDNSTSNRIRWLECLGNESAVFDAFALVYYSVGNILFFTGIGFDTTTNNNAQMGGLGQTPASAGANGANQQVARLIASGIGVHFVQHVEKGDGTNADTIQTSQGSGLFGTIMA